MVLYLISFDEDDPDHSLPLSRDLAKATDIFVEISRHQACGCRLVDDEGYEYAWYTGYGDTLSGDADRLTTYGPVEDYEGNELEARRWATNYAYEQGLRYQL